MKAALVMFQNPNRLFLGICAEVQFASKQGAILTQVVYGYEPHLAFEAFDVYQCAANDFLSIAQHNWQALFIQVVPVNLAPFLSWPTAFFTAV
ncbi:MAG: hypothetical protein KDC45_03350, partial [Bacteroidetes bacterium]|nr:hypothetical protein [Bacteroidota bacterium]